MSMASLFCLQLLVLSSFTFSSSFKIASTSTKNQRLVTNLIYRDSVFSPLYNPRDKAADRAERILRTSNARFAYLQAKGNTDYLEGNDDMIAQLYSDDNIFLVSFSIGQPPMPMLAIMDTGSSLTWVQCKPYPGAVFDPSKSSTYANISCDDPACATQSFLPTRFSCNDVVGLCIYLNVYIDGTTSAGHMATEQLTFGTSDDGTFVTPSIRFGCSERGKYLGRRRDGIMGLGSLNELSIVHSLGSRFSYCIGNLSDRKYRFNQLAFGDWANLEGYSTPLKISGKYHLTLEGISVGQERLDINPAIFKSVIIDTGSYLTYIPFDAYYRIEDKVSSMLDRELDRYERQSGRTKSLCYQGNMSQDLQGFPVLTFHLAQGADLVLDVGNLFFEQDEGKAFCMSISPPYGADSKDITVIGVMAQQFYNFGYDLTEKKLYFQRIDCDALND